MHASLPIELLLFQPPIPMHTAVCESPAFWHGWPVPDESPARPCWSVMNASGTEDDPPADWDTNALVAAALRQDHSAFAELVRRYKAKVFGLAARFTRDTHELEDVCQEIFIQAYRKLGAFRGDAPFEHWLTRIATRKCYDLLRRTRRERESHISLEAAHDRMEDAATGREMEARESRETLNRALAMLSPQERLVLTLLELEDHPVREVSAATGWSEANVRTRACRARATLKQILQRQQST